MNFLLALPNSLKICLLSLLVLIPLGLYTKHLYKALTEQKSANAVLSDELTRMNIIAEKTGQWEKFKSKGLDDGLSKIRANKSPDSPVPDVVFDNLNGMQHYRDIP